MSMAVDASGSTDLQELDVHVRIDYVTVTLSPALVQLMTRIAKSFIPEKVCTVRTCVCQGGGGGGYMCMCVHTCVLAFSVCV